MAQKKWSDYKKGLATPPGNAQNSYECLVTFRSLGAEMFKNTSLTLEAHNLAALLLADLDPRA